MSFRNPLSSLSADAITPGTLPAGVVAQAVRSAPAGNRTVLEQDANAGLLAFFAGIDAEQPATVQALTSTGVAGDQELTIRGGVSPVVAPLTGPPEISLTSAPDAEGDWRSRIVLAADHVYVAGAEISRAPRLVTLAGAQTGGTEFPLCHVDLDPGRWLLIGKGFADWSVAGAPRYIVRLREGSDVLDESQVYNGQSNGSAPWLVAALVAAPPGGVSVELTAMTNNWTAGAAPVQRVMLAALPVL